MSIDIGTCDTFPKLLLLHARVRGALPAMREKDLGIWQTWTWRRRCRRGARARLRPGRPGAEARRPHGAGRRQPAAPVRRDAAPRSALGAIPVPLYQDAVGRRDARSRSRTPRSRIASSRTRSRSTSCSRSATELPAARRTSSTTTRAACATTTQPGLHDATTTLLEAGRACAQARPGLLRRRDRARAAPTTSAAMFFTSGTTGKPKGVVHTHHALHRPRHAPAPSFDKLSDRRRGAGLPAAGLDRAEHLQLRAVAGLRLRASTAPSRPRR